MVIGLVVAMDAETSAISRYYDAVKEETFNSLVFYIGKIANKEVVMVKSGVGKVNAAIAATVLCEKYRPDIIISTGIAGGLGRSKVLDVVIADKVVQHDFDTTPLGDPKGIVSKVDEKLLEALKGVLPTAKVGTVASGDQFICDSGVAAIIIDDFNAIACEMECAAVARVAEVFNVPFGAIKVISDGGNDGAELTFAQMCEKASEMNARTVCEFVNRT